MEEVEPLSIYLDLKQGQKADLEVVARASLQYAAALKEAAFFLDPSLDLRIELQSGTESSLTLNSLLRAATDKKTLAGLATGATLTFMTFVGQDAYNAAKHHLGLDPARTITDDDAAAIAAKLHQAAQKDPVKSHVQQFYRELDRDSAIDGVGLTRTPNTRPSVIVPRAEFKARSGVDQVIESTEQTRERIAQETLVLVSPVLLNSDRKWRFKSGTGEFGASIDDEQFLEQVLSGRRSVPMIAGLQIDVELKTIEEKTPEGLWKPIDRSVVRVIQMRLPPSQPSLNLRGGDNSSDDVN